MSEQKEKRMVADTGYEVLLSEWVGGKEFIVAENPQADETERYMAATYERKAFLGQYFDVVVGDEYDDAAQEFEKRVNTAREVIESELDKRGFPSELFTAEQCVPHSYEQDINKKVVAIKPECLADEYRRGSEQLMYVTGGFGASRNSRGTAVFCVQLSDGTKARYERYQVLGIVKDLPDWAKQRLDTVKADIAKSRKERNDAR
ncbi:MAG: hypothetical protein LBS74_08860 [Oscillospiraceae bacterium]|jgi:hypothetical protein|nr:hypothetical protein [Oscillospiraceae bacterium]